jgi:hypothetical protein
MAVEIENADVIPAVESRISARWVQPGLVATVAVCRKCKGHECVLEFLEELTDANVDLVKCQKVCQGALVGLDVGGKMEWFERVAKPKPLVAVAMLLSGRRHGKKLPRPLMDRRVKKLSGRSPRS